MKKLCLLVLILSSLSFGQDNPDILVYSRVTKDWNVYLLDKFQVFMKNLRLNVDPYTYQHDKVINYDESSINDFVSSDVENFIKTIEDASGLSILDLTPELSLTGFGYSIDQIHPEITPSERNGNLVMDSNIQLRGIKSFAKELKLSFLISHLSGKEMISALDVKIMNPKITIKENSELSFKLNMMLEERNLETVLRFTKADFSAMTEAFNTNEDLIDISYESVQIPHVELNLMGRSITVNASKVKEIIDTNKDQIKKLFVGQIKTLFEKNGALEVLKHFDGYTFRNERWIKPTSKSTFPMYLQVKDFFNPMQGTVGVELVGDFCDTNNFDVNGANCIHSRVTQPAKSMTSTANKVYSKENMAELMSLDSDIMMLASVSEDYINKALATTIDFGLWDEKLEQVGLKLGDKGVQVRFNKKAATATLYLDVIYKATKMQRFFTREKNIRFPLILDVKIRIEDEEQMTFDERTGQWTQSRIPFVVFNIFDVDLDDNNFKYGIEKYDLPTTISNVRKVFRKKVIKTIKKELLDYNAPGDKMTLLKWKGTDVPPIELPEVTGMDLDKVDTHSDGHGRLNIIMRASKNLAE